MQARRSLRPIRQALSLPSRNSIPIRYASSAAPSSGSPKTTALLAVAALGAAATVHYYPSLNPLTLLGFTAPEDDGQSSTSPGTFSVTTGSGSRRREHTFDLLTNAQVEGRLKEHEATVQQERRGNPVVRWDRNWVASNEPCEDRSAVDVIPRSRSAKDVGLSGWWSSSSSTATASTRELDGSAGEKGATGADGSKDLALFSIMDGHAGHATSELLSKVLHPTLALGLAGLQAGRVPGEEGWKGMLGKWAPWSWGREVWNEGNVAKQLAVSYETLDQNLSRSPLALLPAYHNLLSLHARSPTPSPELRDQIITQRKTIAALTEAADNGACAITTLVDAEAGDLYVASTGDCRAVAGWEKDGVWRCDVLSEDQMGENPREIERMKTEHPGEEETVIMRGRVMGGLQPTRAFGDASYKWTDGEWEQLNAIMQAEGYKFRKQRPWHKTPPYVTARPEVTHRKLRSETGEKLRFVVMATDGLWDNMTSEEATLLLASHLAHPTHSDIHKSTLPQQFPLAPYPGQSADAATTPAQQAALTAGTRLYPVEDLPGSAPRSNGTWCFAGDDNAATHLIRNSLGGGDKAKRRELLSLKGDVSRWFRDDVTVTVVFFDDIDKPSTGTATSQTA